MTYGMVRDGACSSAMRGWMFKYESRKGCGARVLLLRSPWHLENGFWSSQLQRLQEGAVVRRCYVEGQPRMRGGGAPLGYGAMGLHAL